MKMDLLMIGAILALWLVTWGAVAGCARLGATP